MSEARVRHVLGLSGGRDSAALAVFMRQHHPEIELEYFFTDTGRALLKRLSSTGGDGEMALLEREERTGRQRAARATSPADGSVTLF